MTQSSSIPEVKQFILERFLAGEDPSKLALDTPLVSGGIIDSLGMLDLVAFLETKYSVEFEAHEVAPANFETLTSIDTLLQSKRSKAGT